ncbi:MAG: hypothetical protein ACOH2A_04380 [Sphingobacteriaceae bacterium]
MLIFIAVKARQFDDFNKNFDLDLAVLLVASLVIDLALIVLGAVNCVASGVLRVSGSGSIAAIPLLFVVTLIIISVISNTATVAIVFSLAVSLAAQLPISSTPVFVDTAFASSCRFIMSIGYINVI